MIVLRYVRFLDESERMDGDAWLKEKAALVAEFGRELELLLDRPPVRSPASHPLACI